MAKAALGQMAMLFSLIIIGYGLMKTRLIPENSAVVLARLENYLFIPALVFITFHDYFTREKLRSAGNIFLIGTMIGCIMIPLAITIAKSCSTDHYIRNIYTYGLVFSNFGYMGNSVMNAVFSEMFPEYLIFTLPLWIMIYLWGVPCLLIPSGKSQGIRERFKAFLNPMILSMLAGMAVGIMDIQVPDFLLLVARVSGNCMSPIAMLLSGISMAAMNFKKVLSNRGIYVIAFFRLIVFPLIFIGIFTLVPATKIIVVCTVCSLAMPLGMNTIVIPAAYGKDNSVAAGMMIVSHLCSCATIPFVFFLMDKILI